MRLRFRRNGFLLGLVLFISFLLAFPLWREQAQERRSRTARLQAKLEHREIPNDDKPEQHPADGYSIVETSGGLMCRQMNVREHQEMRVHERAVEMQVIQKERQHLTPPIGLKIILRGTSQLDRSPEAKAGFERAAAKWEGIIRDPITIVLDVDYGPTRFGERYSSGVIGATDTVDIILNNEYRRLRLQGLVARAIDPIQSSAFSSLPVESLPTDLGPTTSVSATSPQLRMLGYLPEEADPNVEDELGPPPSIGFNSDIRFDFDATDGIEPQKYDFEAVAFHEIGHALGFVSTVGYKENLLESQNAPAIFDFFRFASGGLTSNDVTGQPRLQLAGGNHSYFDGSVEYGLSTSDPFGGGGGDGRQASHWKDEALTGHYIGIMDPSIAHGTRMYLTAADVRAASLFGYWVNPETPVFEVISPVEPEGAFEVLEVPNALYVNRFTPSRFPSTLHSFRLEFPGELVYGADSYTGQPLRVVAFIDPNRTGQPPANPTLIVDRTLLIPERGFRGIEIPFPNSLVIESGDLYIGVQTTSAQVRFRGEGGSTQPKASFISTNNGGSFQPLRDDLGMPVSLVLSAVVTNRYGAMPTPIAAALSPSALPPGSAAFTLVVSGSGFQENSVVRWNGADRPTTFVNGNVLTAQIPAADVTNAGAAKVTVFTPTAGISGALNFSITAEKPEPVIARLEPEQMTISDVAQTLSVFGGNFTPQSVVRLDGMGLTTTFVNSIQVTARVPASILAAAGVSKVSVFTPGPGGGSSTELNFEVVFCNYTLSEEERPSTSFGSSTSVVLQTSKACAWNVASDQPWITVSRPTAGNGFGKSVIDFNIAPNTDTARRGNLTVGRRRFAVKQMGRATAVSAASFNNPSNMAPDSIVSLFGSGLARGSVSASTQPLPFYLGGTDVSIEFERTSSLIIGYRPQLFSVAPGQINFLVPIHFKDYLERNPGGGIRPITVYVDGVPVADAQPYLSATAPGLFTASADGRGFATATALRVKRDGSQSFEPIVRFDATQNRFVAVPIDLGPEGDRVFIVLFGTGIRGYRNLQDIRLSIGNVTVPVAFAGAQGSFDGLDQVNAELPRTLVGRGEVIVNLSIGNTAANPVTIAIK